MGDRGTPRLTPDQVIAVLRKSGFKLAGSSGSHQKWRNPLTGKQGSFLITEAEFCPSEQCGPSLRAAESNWKRDLIETLAAALEWIRHAVPRQSAVKGRPREGSSQSDPKRHAGQRFGRRRRIPARHAECPGVGRRTARWVEICFCSTPLQEDRPYWEQYFDLNRIQDAHDRGRCRDKNGSEPWACIDCDCTGKLERKLAATGKSFLAALRRELSSCEEPPDLR